MSHFQLPRQFRLHTDPMDLARDKIHSRFPTLQGISGDSPSGYWNETQGGPPAYYYVGLHEAQSRGWSVPIVAPRGTPGIIYILAVNPNGTLSKTSTEYPPTNYLGPMPNAADRDFVLPPLDAWAQYMVDQQVATEKARYIADVQAVMAAAAANLAAHYPVATPIATDPVTGAPLGTQNGVTPTGSTGGTSSSGTAPVTSGGTAALLSSIPPTIAGFDSKYVLMGGAALLLVMMMGGRR